MFFKKKSLGQHFLRGKVLAEKIVKELAIEPGDVVVEIGPGEGILTDIILAQFPNGEISFFVIEKDGRLIAQLKQKSSAPWYHVYHEDVLAFLMGNCCPRGKKMKVIGNIPYYITSDIIFKLIEDRRYISHIVLTVQYEYAERLFAQPRTKAYGRLTVMVQTFCIVKKCFKISRLAFQPIPNVDSAVVRLTFREMTENRRAIAYRQAVYEQMVKYAFSQRRKTLANNLKPLLTTAERKQIFESFLGKYGFPEFVRAEELSAEQFVDLCVHIMQ